MKNEYHVSITKSGCLKLYKKYKEGKQQQQLTAHHSTHSPHSVAFQNILSTYLKPALHALGAPLSPFKQLVPVISFLSFFFCLAILKLFCLPSLECNVSACFFITSACILAIHFLNN